MGGWQVLLMMLDLLTILILVRVVLSWIVSPVSRNPLVEMVRQVTDVILRPIQSVMPNLGPIDISPMVAILALSLLKTLIASAAY
ncbi:MAG TPA: YggT family protein [Longimicrobium sp.]|nr:YggT family protein [Longimicrobium sp.]